MTGTASRRAVSTMLALLAVAALVRVPSASAASCADVTWVDSHGDANGSAAVVLVHGWTGSPAMWTGSTIDQGISRFTEPRGDSFADLLDQMPGVDVWVLDYSDTSARWVTDDDAGGPRLLAAVECLHERYRTAVGLVGHSMGGLAARWVADQVPEKVAAAVSIGTPHTGSDIAAVAGYLLGVADAGVLPSGWTGVASRAVVELVQLCGRRTTESLDACGPFLQQAGAFDSDAGRALRTGSSELASLPGWPEALPTMAIAGGIEGRWRSRTLFGVRTSTVARAGDLVVDSASATDLGDEKHPLTCGHVLSTDPVDAFPEDWNLSFRPIDERPVSVANLLSSPCAHWKLASTLDVATRTMGLIGDHLIPLRERLASARVPSVCYDKHPPTTLVDGRHTEIGPNDGSFELHLDDPGGPRDLQLLRGTPEGDLVAVVASCNGGGVGWPNPVVLFHADDGRAGEYHSATFFFDFDWDAVRLSGPSRAGIGRLSADGDRLIVEMAAYARGEGGCCFTAHATVTAEVRDGELRTMDVDAQLNPAAELAYAVAGDDGGSRCASFDVRAYLVTETAEVAVCNDGGSRLDDDLTYYARRWRDDPDVGIALGDVETDGRSWVARNGGTAYQVTLLGDGDRGRLLITGPDGQQLLDEQGPATVSPVAPRTGQPQLQRPSG